MRARSSMVPRIIATVTSPGVSARSATPPRKTAICSLTLNGVFTPMALILRSLEIGPGHPRRPSGCFLAHHGLGGLAERGQHPLAVRVVVDDPGRRIAGSRPPAHDGQF